MKDSEYLQTSLILLIISFTAILLTISQPDTVYKRTIFQRLPGQAVVSLFFVGTYAYTCTLYKALTNRNHYIGILLLVCVYLIYFSLPKYAGVVLYGGHGSDIVFHIGNAKSIVQTGFIPPSDWYPIVHIQLSIFQMVTNMPMPAAQRVFPPVFILTFSLGMGLLVRKIASSRKIGNVAVIVSFPLIFGEFHTGFHPSFVVIYLFPIFAYIILNNGYRYRYLLLLVGTSVSLFHPLTSPISILFAVVFLITYPLVANKNVVANLIKKETVVLVFFSVLWSYWYFTFERTPHLITTTLGISGENLDSDPGSDGTTSGGGIIEQFIQSFDNTVTFDVLVEIILENYAPTIVYAIATVIGIFMLVQYRSILGYCIKQVAALFTVVLIGLLFAAPFFLGDFIVGNPIRASRWAVIGSIPIISLVISNISSNNKEIATVFIIVLLISAFPLGLYTADTENQHLRAQTVDGANWLLSHYNPELDVKSQSLTSRLNMYLTGPMGISPLNYKLPNQSLERPTQIDANTSLSDAYECSYIVAREYDRKHYLHLSTDRRQGLSYLTNSDISEINNSPEIQKTYSNKATHIWKVC